MHRIYKSEVIKNESTKEYVIRTVFFNGEVREFNIEMFVEDIKQKKWLEKYAELGKALELNSVRTKVKVGDEKGKCEEIGSESLYCYGNLVGVEYIDDVNIQLATRLQAMRESRRMTQADLEKKSGIHQAEISKIERGIGNPSIDTLKRLAKAVDHRLSVSFEDRNIRRDVPESLAAAPYLKSGKFQGEYTVADIMELPEDVRVELIDGCIFDMATPTIQHQRISMNMSAEIYNFIKSNKGKCEVLAAPGLTFNKDEKHYLVPDVAIVCDKNKLKENYIVGAPDFVLEIISKSNSSMDYSAKCKVYKEKGVSEYWILDPIKKRLVVYFFEKDDIPTVYGLNEIVPVEIYKGKLKINLGEMNV